MLLLLCHNRLSYVNTLAGHEGAVSVVATSPTLGDIASVCTSKPPKHSSKRKSYYYSTTSIYKLVSCTIERVTIHAVSMIQVIPE